MEETAIVMQVREGEAMVSAQRQSACGHCSVNSSCGTSVLSRHIGKRSMQMWVSDPIGVKEGDTVTIQIQEGGLLLGSLAVYLLPLLLLMAAALLGEAVARNLMLDSEITSIVFAASGLLIASMWLRHFNRRIKSSERYRPTIIKRTNTINFITHGSPASSN
ncbi:MAG: SoxR reducing system RseC family protein [Gammaproteobacteria bacterium]|nr:SoxR reducing system RseC family protein [Gammaproteobacteria bacterium]